MQHISEEERLEFLSLRRDPLLAGESLQEIAPKLVDSLTGPDASAELRRADLAEIEEAGWFAPDALPAPLSLATARRIAEYRQGLTGLGAW